MNRINPTSFIEASALIADFDGDLINDILVPAPNGLMYAFNYHGDLIQGFPIAVGEIGSSTPVISDVEADGIPDIFISGEDGFLYAFTTSRNSTKIAWNQWAHDAQHSSRSSESNTIIPSGEKSLLPEKKVYNYPNPVRQGSTKIRYYLTESATVTIRIYDMAGDLVKKLAGPGIAQTDNEVIWNLQNIQSGVYFAKVEAKSGKTTVVRTVKIAVTK